MTKSGNLVYTAFILDRSENLFQFSQTPDIYVYPGKTISRPHLECPKFPSDPAPQLAIIRQVPISLIISRRGVAPRPSERTIQSLDSSFRSAKIEKIG